MQSDCSSMECSLEGKYAQLWRSWSLVLQHCIHLLLGELCPAVALTMHVAHEHHLDPVFVGAGTTHHWKDLLQRKRDQDDVHALHEHHLDPVFVGAGTTHH